MARTLWRPIAKPYEQVLLDVVGHLVEEVHIKVA